MNQKMKIRYSKVENIRFLQDFNIVNIKWLHFCRKDDWKNDCQIHLFCKALNELIAGNNDTEKKNSDFKFFMTENLSTFF